VTLLNASSASPQLHICLPRIAAESVLCEPWGEKWQRIGAPLPSCIALDVRAVASWYSELRSAPPFLAEDDPQLERALAAKRRQRAQQQHSSADDDDVNGHENVESFRALLRASSRHERRHHQSQSEWNRPGRFASCALVGSGHDLQCGTREMGSFIDSHDRVFRSNAAQHYSLGSVGHMMHNALRSHKSWRFLFLLKTRVEPERAGRRTDFRTNCLWASDVVGRNESCIVGHR